MDTGNAVFHFFYPFYRVHAGSRQPVGIQGDAHFFGGKGIEQNFDKPPAGEFFKFKIVVVIHKVFACRPDFPRHWQVIIGEVVHPFGSPISLRHRTDTDIIAPQNFVIPNHIIRVAQ